MELVARSIAGWVVTVTDVSVELFGRRRVEVNIIFLNFGYLRLGVKLYRTAVCSVLGCVFVSWNYLYLLNLMLGNPFALGRILRRDLVVHRLGFGVNFWLLLLCRIELCLMHLLGIRLPLVFLGHGLISLFLSRASDLLFVIVVNIVLYLLSVLAIFLIFFFIHVTKVKYVSAFTHFHFPWGSVLVEVILITAVFSSRLIVTFSTLSVLNFFLFLTTTGVSAGLFLRLISFNLLGFYLFLIILRLLVVLIVHLLVVHFLFLFFLLLPHLEELSADAFTVFNTEFVVKDWVGDYWAHIINHWEHLKGGNETHKLIIIWVIIPGGTRETILRLELVTVGRVVDDNNISQIPAGSLHILYKLSPVESAVLSK
jgi:hypothetical protein